VIHHTPNPKEIIAEFHRVLRPGQKAQIMVYNFESIWVHLYVAYQRQVVEGIDAKLPLEEAFRKSTDGEHCPISRFYRIEDFLALCSQCGFIAFLLGCGVTLWEMSLLGVRFKALMDERLGHTHRKFLKELRFNEFGFPITPMGRVAGIPAVYELIKR
jgi:hypothetical protein